MRTATLMWRALAALALPFALVSSASIPLVQSSDTSPLEARSISGTFGIQRCAAPREGQWYGRSDNLAGIDPYYTDFGNVNSLIRKITAYHQNARIWHFEVEWQNGQKKAFGSTDWATGSSISESFTLLDDEVITFMHAQTYPKDSHIGSVISVQFQTNKGRWSPRFGRDRSKNLPPGLGRDYYGKQFITAGNVMPQNTPLGQSSWEPLQYINSFQLYMYGTNIGMQAISPTWKSHDTIKPRKITDIRSEEYAGQNLEGYEGYWTDAVTFMTQKLDTAKLSQIQLWKRGNYVAAMKLTWSDGVNGFESLVGSTSGLGTGTTFEFKENQSIVEIRFWHSSIRDNANSPGGVYSIEFVYNTYTVGSDGKVSSTQNITPAFGGSNPSSLPHAESGDWKAPDKARYSLIGFNGLWARPDGKASLDQIRAMKPLWIQDSPIGTNLDIKSVNHGKIMPGIDEVAAGSNAIGINNSPTCLELSGSYTYTSTKTNTIAVSDTTSVTSGVSMTIDTTLTVGASAFGASVETELHLGFEAFTEVGKEHTQEKAWETSDEVQKVVSWRAVIPPYSYYSITVTSGTATVEDSTWTGTLVATYRDGSKEEYDVSGTFKGFDNGMQTLVTTYYEPLEGHDLPDGWTCPNSRIAKPSGDVVYKKTTGLKEKVEGGN